MPLPASLAVLCVLFALVPGWLYLQKIERTRPPSSDSGLRELLQVLAVGLGTTGVAIVVAVLVPNDWVPFLLDLDKLEGEGLTYAQTNLRKAILTAGTLLLVACVAAQLLYFVRSRKTPPTFRPSGDVWVYALGDFPKGVVPHIGVIVTDGTLYEGVLHSYTLNPEASEVRDIALKDRIRMTGPQTTTAQSFDVDRLIISASQIRLISVTYVDSSGSRVTQTPEQPGLRDRVRLAYEALRQ